MTTSRALPICALSLLLAAPAAAAPRAASAEAAHAAAERLDTLAAEREALLPIFAEAEALYPGLPEGLLPALAWSASRWMHLRPEAPVAGPHHTPQTYGVMGLSRGQGGRADVVAEAARALGVSPAAVLADPRTNVLATAALLDAYGQALGLDGAEVWAWGPALARLSGLPDDGGAVSAFVRDSYVYDILLSLDRGVDDLGARVPVVPIPWARAFEPDALAALRAPMVRVVVDADLVTLPDGSAFNPATAALDAGGRGADASRTSATVDYPTALWVASPNYSSRNGTAITHVAIHTTQGSYSGAISWCANPDSNVSAHYIVRSSDGQITQMVREADKAWHVGSENPYTIGIEHEGWVDDPSWYTEALYGASSALTRDICADNAIDCGTCYDGASSSTVVVLSSSYHVKGHQHYPNQTHTDPGIYWNWPKYADLVDGDGDGGGWGDNLPGGGGWGGNLPTGGGGALKTVLDDFEVSEGHFNTQPTYSGSTVGISAASTADRASGQAHGGSYAEKITLVDDSASSASWSVRFLSGSGSPAANTAFSTTKGKVGFWVYTDASGVSAGPLVDDSDGIELGTARTIPAGVWTWLEWSLVDDGVWDAWFSGNGALDAATATLDAVLFLRAQSSSPVTIYLDDVMVRR